MGVGESATGARPTEAVVDLDACAHNLARVRQRVGDLHVWAVVKADAYGHGAVPVARCLVAGGAHGLAVATVDEGLELRAAGIAAPILVMAGIEPEVAAAAAAAARAGLTVALWSIETARAASRAVAAGELVVHLKVDTGMGRLGVLPDEALALARAITDLPPLHLDGIFSNLAAADLVELAESGEPTRAHQPGPQGSELRAGRYTAEQVDRFATVCGQLDAHGLAPSHRHMANSAALQNVPASWRAGWCTGVRPGLALYGAVEGACREPLDLRPVMALHTRIAALRELPAGWSVGYGLRHVTRGPRRIAVLPVGYHDGWPRCLGDRARVLVGDRPARVVGAVNMDLTLVDVSDLPEAVVGAPVTLIGGPGAPATGPRGDGAVGAVPAIPVEEVAAAAGTIPHEILSRIGRRVPRRHLGGAREAAG